MSTLPQGGKYEYEGFRIRTSPPNLISLSDFWKLERISQGQELRGCRPDVYVKLPLVQAKLINDCKRLNITPTYFSDGKIRSVPGVIEIIKGGGADQLQGTLAIAEYAIGYAEFLSPKLGEWAKVTFGTPVNGALKAKEVTIWLGTIPLQVFQLPTGEYRLSQAQVAKAIAKGEVSFRDFLKSKSLEALPYKGFRSVKWSVEGNNAPINAIPIKIAIAYWIKEASGNIAAARLLGACAEESIERRADKAFGTQRTEEEYNQRFSQNLQELAKYFVDCKELVVASESFTSLVSTKQQLKALLRKNSSQSFPLKKADFIDQLTLLAAEGEWPLRLYQPLPNPPGAETQTRYPDLVSDVFEQVIDNQAKRIVYLFQGKDGIITENDIRDCFYVRKYIEVAKERYQADYALMFFVSPYGATPYATAEIEQDESLRDCVRVVTVRYLANFLRAKAFQSKRDKLQKSRINKKFGILFNYKDANEFVPKTQEKSSAPQWSQLGLEL